VKFLFIANRFPYPPYRGDKLKIWNLARRLSKHHELHLATFLEHTEDLKHLDALSPYFTRIHTVALPRWKSWLNCTLNIGFDTPFQVAYFRSAAMRKLTSRLLHTEQYNAVHVQHLRMAQYVAEPEKHRAVLDLPDAFSLYWERRKNAAGPRWQRWFNQLEYARVKQYEKVLHRFPLNLVCSVEDCTYLQKKEPSARIALLPNGVDSATFHPRDAADEIPDRILFTGNMDYAPNVDAVQHFCANIFPFICEQRPHAQFVIAGQRPVDAVKALAAENISVTGFIENLRTEYAKAAVVVAPLRFGAGTQNKVLEAMSVGVPVVCSPFAFNGLGIAPDQGVARCNNDREFADAVIRLLQDASLRQDAGNKSKDIIRDRFDWDIIAAQLESYLIEVAENR
jgi:polysaccharide biosynthesis protein PslH